MEAYEKGRIDQGRKKLKAFAAKLGKDLSLTTVRNYERHLAARHSLSSGTSVQNESTLISGTNCDENNGNSNIKK